MVSSGALLAAPAEGAGRCRGESGGTVSRTQTRPGSKCTNPARANSARWSGSGRERPRRAAVISRRRSATAPGPGTAVQ
jgi:hypothetical protein